MKWPEWWDWELEISPHRRRAWEIIVEPDFDEHLLVVITAYPIFGA